MNSKSHPTSAILDDVTSLKGRVARSKLTFDPFLLLGVHVHPQSNATPIFHEPIRSSPCLPRDPSRPIRFPASKRGKFPPMGIHYYYQHWYSGTQFTKLGFCCDFIGILYGSTNIGIVKTSNTKLGFCCDFTGILSSEKPTLGYQKCNLPRCFLL